MNTLMDLIYYSDDALKTMVALCVFSFTFEFVLSFAYILRSAKNSLGV